VRDNRPVAGDDQQRALRAQIRPAQMAPEFVADLRSLALALGLRGWVRGDGPVQAPVTIHAEGPPDRLGHLVDRLSGTATVQVSPTRREGHEQFAVRGVSAGVFVVQEHRASTHHYDLRLEVQGTMRSWAVPKGPSLDPAVKRLAVQVSDHALSHNTFEAIADGGGVIVWDRGDYEQGGRVPWPEALRRGHAVFVLHGEKLRGGFALQRTRKSDPAQWLLIKRRDEQARPGSDVTAEQPHSVASGRTLTELISGGA
jgi:DNA ligase D-like protein (predicted 3'-phosphoesterase)